MENTIFEIFVMTPEREKELWKNSIFVFDTSSICELYNLTEDAKKTITDILLKLKDRIWIPAQVMYEYLKNRDKVILNPIEELYQDPKEIKNCHLPEQLKDFIEHHKEIYYHPFFNKEEHSKLVEKSEQLTLLIKEIKEIIANQYKKRREEILSIKKDDCIYNTFIVFDVGIPFKTTQIMDVIKEGEMRYRHQIPPGYMDEKDKIGTQIYGDLIIWKEILNYANEQNKSIILICNDIKIDWYNEHNKRTIAETPRHELIKEFCDTTNCDFWMYTLRKFIDKLEEQYKDPSVLPLFSGLDAVKLILEQRERETWKQKKPKEIMTLQCGNCFHVFDINIDDFDWDWDSESSTERGMGNEIEYVTNEYCKCPNCGNEIGIDFHLWEYPIGAVNYTSIECDGGDIVEECDFSDKISLHELEACCVCGEYANLDENDMCESCKNEFERKISKDD